MQEVLALLGFVGPVGLILWLIGARHLWFRRTLRKSPHRN